ncbi:MAG: ParA family protein [Chloroflexota bacterium]
MQVVTVMNQKGGVGKTTTTLNLAAALKEVGWRVLVVDFDPQGSLSTCCGVSEPGRLGPGQTIADAVLTTVRGPAARRVSLRDVVVSTRSGIDLVPSSQQLATAEAALYTVYGREYALRDTLHEARDYYDLILVDSVPTLGLLAVNGLAAADGLIIPVQAEYLAVFGLAQLLHNVALVRERLNPRLEIWGVLLTMVDGRTRHSREVVAAVRETLPGQVPVFDTQIPVDVRLKDSARAGISVLGYDPVARASVAYRELAGEVGRLLGAVKAGEAEPTPDPPKQLVEATPFEMASPVGPADGPAARGTESFSLASRLGPSGRPAEQAWDHSGLASVGAPMNRVGASSLVAPTALESSLANPELSPMPLDAGSIDFARPAYSTGPTTASLAEDDGFDPDTLDLDEPIASSAGGAASRTSDGRRAEAAELAAVGQTEDDDGEMAGDTARSFKRIRVLKWRT